jgi:hypothetical protein
MQHRAVLVLLLTISAAVFSGPLNRGMLLQLRQNGTSGGEGQIVDTWRLISRVVTSEDGTPVQDPGLGKTPSGYLIYDSSTNHYAFGWRSGSPLR